MEQECAQQQNNNNNANTVQNNFKITLDNAEKFLIYYEKFGVLICRFHHYAVRNLENHLRTHHTGSRKERQAVVDAYQHCQLRNPASVPLPAPLGRPFASLGKPQKAYTCNEPGCEEISINRNVIRIHCNKTHNWKSSAAEREHWRRVWVQTFFTAAGLQRYFTVQFEEDEADSRSDAESETEGRHTTDNSQEISTILQKWDEAKTKHEQTLKVADAEIAKTDQTLWFKRNGWAEHLKKSNLKHLSRAARLPDRDEKVLREACEAVEKLIEKCVASLSTLDLEIRRWLRSAKLSEPDVRPMARLQNRDSQARYAGYMKRCLCYCMRVWKSLENNVDSSDETDSESGASSDGESSGNSESEVSDQSGARRNNTAATDVFYDAKRLFPWQEHLQKQLEKIWEAFEEGRAEEEQAKRVHEFFEFLIFQHVRGDVFRSALLHFLAVLGIDDETNRLRQANDFSYILAGVVYCVRVLAVEIILPSAERDEQGERDDRRFRRLRDEYLADGSFSVMSKMLSLLAYGKSIALNHSNAGSVLWSRDGREMTIHGRRIVIAQFTKMVRDVITEAEDTLWRGLMCVPDRERFEIPLHELEDDVTFTKRGKSFLSNEKNGLDDKREWMLKRALSELAERRLRRNSEWVMKGVRAYLRAVDAFRQLLLFCVHLTSGQPARGSEITTIRYKNGYLQDRNVFAIHGHIVIVTRYHKSQSQYDKPKVIPRFLPWRVGQLMVVYLAYVEPFREYLGVDVVGSGWSDYVWSNEQGPWETSRLTQVITRETQKRLGVRLTTHDYRHTAISIGRKAIGEKFAHGYAAEMVESIEEEEMETDDPLEMSAGRGGEIGANRYGVSMDVIKHLSDRSIDTFRPLSEQWHAFLGLGSVKASKRVRDERSNSAVAELTQAAQERQVRFSTRWNVPADRRDAVEQSGWFFGQSTPARPSITVHNSSPAGASLDSEGVLTPAAPWNQWGMHTPVGSSARAAFSHPVGSAVETVISGPTPAAVPTEAMIRKAAAKALRSENFSFRSKQQEEALYTIVGNEPITPLVVVLPTGGGKSLLFMAPACLENPGVTVVVVPYRALINNLVATARRAGIDCIEWVPGEVNPAALVFVSADRVAGFMKYGQQMQQKGLLKRVFVDESHLVFTSSDWRPKLMEVRAVRGLRCTTIMLTATLPVTLAFELEAGMAAEMARYIRAETTRAKTRYVVQTCRKGALVEASIELGTRMRKHLGWRKGVVYSRSRAQCEEIAEGLNSAHYHAGAADNEERLREWLEHGGLIVATSALGTGVDFPGIVFVMHVDVPYGMIDFAQESGRGGRAGEDVDSVIVVEEKRVAGMASRMRNVDESVMGEFITTGGCRRAVMSSYLDGKERDCESGDGEFARCDRCGEGVTAVERRHQRAARERQQVEAGLDELGDGCAVCWAQKKAWRHPAFACRRRDGTEGMFCDKFHRSMRYEDKSHSCFKCGISQRLCATGQDERNKCQWPHILVPVMCGLFVGGRMATLRRAGFEGEEGDWKEFARWLGRRHARRVWDELVSNAMRVLIDVIIERELKPAVTEGGEEGEEEEEEEEKEGAEEGEDEGEQREKRERQRGVGRGRLQRVARREARVARRHGENDRSRGGRVGEFMRRLREWEGVCVVCKAAYRKTVRHPWQLCPADDFSRRIVWEGIKQVEGMNEPRGEQGRCWVGWVKCERSDGGGGGCKWSRLAREVAIAVLYVGAQEEGEFTEVQRWVGSDEVFRVAAEADPQQALEQFFAREVEWQGAVSSNMMCELLWRYM